jgi:plasmid replication initiation protein
MVSLSQANNKQVHFSNKFIESSYKLTLIEQKILRVLAACVDKQDYKESYTFSVLELGNLLGCDPKSCYSQIENAADLLMKRFIKIKDPNNHKNWTSYHIIKRATCFNGEFTIHIDEEMKPFYIALENYTRYQLKNILRFRCSHSFKIYDLVKQYEKIGWRELSVDRFREILEFGKNEYKSFHHIRQKVIEPAINEINEKTDLIVKFTPIKTGRKITSIKFEFTPKNKQVSSYVNKNNKLSHNNFEQRDYSEQDLDKYFANLTND